MAGLVIAIGKPKKGLEGKLGGKGEEPEPEEEPTADLDGLAQDIIDAIKTEDAGALRAALEGFCLNVEG